MKDNGIVIAFKIVKWCVKTALVLTGVVPLARCGAGYQKKNGKVTFNGKEVADKNFVVLNTAFGKDDSTVYYKTYAISGADAKTFTALDEHYAKDAGKVYYCDEEREGQNYYLTKHSVIRTIKDADPATFAVLGDGLYGYAKDRARAYCAGKGFAVKDVATLTIINSRFVKDKHAVYYDRVPVKNADPASFRIVNDFYAKDAERVFYYGNGEDGINGIHAVPCRSAFFQPMDYPYSKDDAAVFYLYTQVAGADARTFSFVGDNYAKDSKSVYLKNKVLAGADPATFKIALHDEASLEEVAYTMDKRHVYWKDKMIGEADVATFKALGLGYAVDKSRVYHHTAVVKGADAHTFTVYDHGYGDADAEDAKNKFLAGVKLTHPSNQ